MHSITNWKTKLPARVLRACLCVPVFGVPAAAQTTPPPAPAVRQETLRLKFPVGQTLFYNFTEDTEGSYKESRSKLTPIKSHLEMRQHQTVADTRSGDGAGLVDVGIDSLTVTVDGKPVPPPGDGAEAQANRANLAVMAHLARLAVLTNGKLEETLVNPNVNAEEVLLGEDPAHMNALSGIGSLPESPVQVGSQWKSAVFLGLAGEQLSASQSLTAWDKKGDASVAVITQTIRGTFHSPAPSIPPPSSAAGQDAATGAGDMTIQGSVSGTRTVRFNVEAGCVESEDSVVYMTVLLTPKERSSFATPPTQMWVKVKSTLARTTAPAAP